MRVLPFTEEQLRRFFLVLILAGATVLAWLVASYAGLFVGAQINADLVAEDTRRAVAAYRESVATPA